jgi:hypothetical protein
LGTNLIFTASGWANRTNWLLTSTNATLAPAQWTRVATNFSDLSGNCAFTNGIQLGSAVKFYRIGLP